MRRMSLCGYLIVILLTVGAHSFTDQGNVNNQLVRTTVTSNYTITEQDVTSYGIFKRAYLHSYIASYGLDGSNDTMASSTYNENLTYWFVTLNINYTILDVFAYGDLSRGNDMSLNLERNNVSVGMFDCRALSGDYTNKVCPVNSGSAVLADKVQLQRKGYGFYLSEAAIIAKPYIDLVGEVNVSSQYNESSNCWQTVLRWKVKSCCSSVNASIYKNSLPTTLNNSLVSECAASNENSIYSLLLTNEQIIENITINYTSPSMYNHLLRVDSGAISMKISPTDCHLSFLRPSASAGMLTPYAYSVILYRDGVNTTAEISCDRVNCSAHLMELSAAKVYLLQVISSTLFAGETLYAGSANRTFTTRNCSEPQLVKFKVFTQLMPKDPHNLDVKVKFVPGRPNCDGNTTYTMYYVSEYGSDAVVCDSTLYYCSTLMEAYTVYNLTIETRNSWGLTVNATYPPWRSPIKAPSPPVNLDFILSLNETLVVWSPPLKPRGVLLGYQLLIEYDTGKTQDIEVNADVESVNLKNLTEESSLTVQIRAKTVFWSRYSTPLYIYIPHKHLPSVVGKPTVVTSDAGNQSTCANISLSTSSGANHSACQDTIQSKIICRPTDCSAAECSVLSTYTSNNMSCAEHVISVCDLKASVSYDCRVYFTNAYSETSGVVYSFSVKSTISVKEPYTPPSNNLTLILIGVGITVFLLATILIITLLIRKRRRIIRVAEPDAYFSLISSENSSIMSGDN